MNVITLRFLISLTITENIQMRLMDVVTTYLYGPLDNDIYMKVPEGLKIAKVFKSKSQKMYSVKLKQSLYGLK
jgi:Reverse transcriptase (RNA-dependent DNA polymerase)